MTMCAAKNFASTLTRTHRRERRPAKIFQTIAAVVDKDTMPMNAANNLARILTMGMVVALSAATPSLAGTTGQSPGAGAAQQSNQSSDIAITRDIRRAIVK